MKLYVLDDDLKCFRRILRGANTEVNQLKSAWTELRQIRPGGLHRVVEPLQVIFGFQVSLSVSKLRRIKIECRRVL